ncbi:MAG: ABC transporter ATP-binding protein [Bacilli bacterium]
MLTVDNLSFTYDGIKYVLKDINLNFEPGNIYGIFGKSGAGKTTLLSLLAGLEVATNGAIIYNGHDLSSLDRNKYRSQNIGVIFQSFNLLPHLTAVENVILSIDISNIKCDDKKKKAMSLLKKVGIDETKANRRILHLSGGEQQRVSIARALANESEIILADEPTGNLDKDTEKDVIDLLTKLAHHDKKCVIIISHSNKVKENVDFSYNLHNGKIIN